MVYLRGQRFELGTDLVHVYRSGVVQRLSPASLDQNDRLRASFFLAVVHCVHWDFVALRDPNTVILSGENENSRRNGKFESRELPGEPG